MADFGWAYVKGNLITGSAPPSGAVQYNDGNNNLAASADLIFISGSTSELNLTGNLKINGPSSFTGTASFNNNVNFANDISLSPNKKLYLDGTLSTVGQGPYLYASTNSAYFDGDDNLYFYFDSRSSFFYDNTRIIDIYNGKITASVDTRIDGNLTVSGTINANQFNVNVTNQNVVNISSTGSTKFGDSTDDTHIFTGSMEISTSANPLKLYGLQAGTPPNSSSYLALDSNYNLVLTSAAGGSGTISYSRRSVTTTITASILDTILGVTAGSNLEIRLPSAGDYTNGQYFTIKDEGGNSDIYSISILTSGSQTIDGQTSIMLESPYAAINIYSNGLDKFFIY